MPCLLHAHLHGPHTTTTTLWCRYQCGYDDVGYTNALSSMMDAYVDAGYPYTLEDFAVTDIDTVPINETECMTAEITRGWIGEGPE